MGMDSSVVTARGGVKVEKGTEGINGVGENKITNKLRLKK